MSWRTNLVSRHSSLASAKTIFSSLFLVWLLLCSLSASCQQPAQFIANPAADGSRLPRLTVLPNGAVLLSWVETSHVGEQNEQHVLKFAVRDQDRWVRTGVVAKGKDWFINWADFPSVVAIDARFWVAHWLVKTPGGRSYDYDIHLSVSTDAGRSWQPSIKPHRDNVAAEHGFVSIFPVNGSAGILWLDGRDYQKEGTGKFALRYTRLDRDGTLHAEKVIDDNTCTCCWTAAAVTAAGPVAAWRSRREGEIRDHHFARLQGNTWSPPAKLSEEAWSINGCPVNGPVLAANGDQVVVAWFTAADNQPKIRAAFSRDAGVQFTAPIDIDSNQPLGRASAVWLDEKTVVVAWMGAVNKISKQSPLMLRKLSVDGTSQPAFKLLDVDPGRATGVPQMVHDGDELVFAWTAPAPKYGVRTAILTHADLHAD